MMPVIRPVNPVMAPADRSNSPPIISNATATAMMANDDDVNTHVLAPDGRANASVLTAKYRKTMSAATIAPTSGRRRTAASRACSPTRSSRVLLGSATGGGAAVVLMCPPRACGPDERGGVRPRAGPHRRSASAVLGELQHRVGVVLRDDRGTGVDRLTATDVVAVQDLEVDPGNAEVALDIGLLVDRERELAADDVLHHVGVHVEGSDLDAGATGSDGLDGLARHVATEGEDPVEARVRLQLGLDRGLRAGEVGVVDLQVRQLAREGRGRTGAPLLQSDVAGLLDDSESVLHAEVVHLVTGSLARQCLALADVGDRPERLPL